MFWFSMGGESAQLPANEIMDDVAAFLKLQNAPCIFNADLVGQKIGTSVDFNGRQVIYW